MSKLLRSKIRLAVAVGLAMIATMMLLAIPSGMAQAAGYSWNNGNVGPTMYYTNTFYYGSIIHAPAGTPNKPITYLYYFFGFNTLSGQPPAGTSVYLCDDYRCTGDIMGGGGGTLTNFFNGDTAGGEFQFAFYVSASTTHAISPYVLGGNDSVQVAYNNP